MNSKSAAEYVRKFGGYAADLIEGAAFHGSEAINPIKAFQKDHGITAALLSPLEMASRYAHGEKLGVTGSFASTFMKNAQPTIKEGANGVKEAVYDWSLNNMKKGKMAGGLVGIGLATGIAGGLTHDTAGNPDIAGLPGI